ncbi:hypothetical protein [Rugamonas sp.]|uniref:P-loop ATPase, Sll1717 family n=1 Tax=Rugamonas sp. TaxID=1926287 RepID=UPI0025FCC47F|nr:hypothetical protein [Rugamonas sp.]
MKTVLRALDLGNSVAEFDDSLQKYFVENEAFFQLVNDKVDIVAGDKGTGKTALFKILQKRHSSLSQLKGVEILAGFNPAGSPVFQRLVREQQLTEAQYASVWKAYILALIGNWALEIVGDDHSPAFSKLALLLSETGLRSKDDKPETIFSKIINTIQKAIVPKSAEVKFTFSETGIPIVIPKISFDKDAAEKPVVEVSHSNALRLLNECLSDLGYRVWVVLDRLDEAFQGFANIEIPALRALMRTYLDLLEFDNFRLKLFIRRDLLRRIIGDGFVNLTHINARKIEIEWDEQDLLNLLCRRVRDNKEVMSIIEAAPSKKLSDEELFYRLFPAKVDPATRKPTSWNWIMARIRDGNDVKPPRNLIDLAKMARDEQLKAEGRNARAFSEIEPVISADAIRKALEKLSSQRVEDTLLAEAGAGISALIQKFRRAKAEQNIDSLAIVLGLAGEELAAAVRQLVEVGFLEEIKTSWKVPMLYRDGLEITQGKAFQSASSVPDDAETDESLDLS